jgi:hypothetical protein
MEEFIMNKKIKDLAEYGLPNVDLIKWREVSYEIHLSENLWLDLMNNPPKSSNPTSKYILHNLQKFFKLKDTNIKALPIDNRTFNNLFE